MKNRARMMIASIAGLTFLLLQVFFPDLPFSEEQAAGILLLVGAYILGEGLVGEWSRDNFKALLRSNKFHAAAGGLMLWLLQAFFPELPITQEQMINILSLLSALIVGAGVQGAVSRSPGAVG